MGEGGGGEKRKVSLLQFSPFFASIFPLFPQKRLILRLTLSTLVKADVSRGKAARNACNIWYGLHSPQVTFVCDERDNVYSL